MWMELRVGKSLSEQSKWMVLESRLVGIWLCTSLDAGNDRETMKFYSFHRFFSRFSKDISLEAPSNSFNVPENLTNSNETLQTLFLSYQTFQNSLILSCVFNNQVSKLECHWTSWKFSPNYFKSILPSKPPKFTQNPSTYKHISSFIPQQNLIFITRLSVATEKQRKFIFHPLKSGEMKITHQHWGMTGY
jgi:hypothetical protein